MKTFLVATDFSSSAKNAAMYAASLASKMNAKLILFHAFHVPVPALDMPTPILTIIALEKNKKKLAEKEAIRIKNKYNVPIEILTSPGFAVEEIIHLEKKKALDLIILGMKGAGKIAEVIIGSSATSVIRKSKTPVLLIPEKAAFSNLDKIVLACDYKIKVNPKNLSFLKELAKIFQSEIDLVHVVPHESKIPAEGKNSEAAKIGSYLGDLKHVSFFPMNEDFVDGMDVFLKKNKIGIVSIIPQKHNLFERLFRESNTKRMAFHTKIPLLALPNIN